MSAEVGEGAEREPGSGVEEASKVETTAWHVAVADDGGDGAD